MPFLVRFPGPWMEFPYLVRVMAPSVCTVPPPGPKIHGCTPEPVLTLAVPSSKPELK